MRDISFLFIGRPAPAPSPDGPLLPAAYLRLRREAAGLTIDQAAAKIAPQPSDRTDATDLIRQLETDGVRARHRTTIDWLTAAFPFDPAVYHSLAEEAPGYHPNVCRGCGCSLWDPCVSGDGHETCSWASDDECTRCADAPASAAAA